MLVNVQITEKADYFLIEVEGRLEYNTVHHLKAALDKIEESGQHKVLLDLSNVTVFTAGPVFTIAEAEKKGFRFALLANKDSVFRNSWDGGWPEFLAEHWELHSTTEEALITLNAG